MRHLHDIGRALTPVVLVALAGAAAAADLPAGNSIVGDYLEARTAEVYVGYCLANSEVNLSGREAILTWRVRQGSWQGTDLGGLAVVAVVAADETLGDVAREPVPARARVLVDEAASARQAAALVDLARAMAGPLLAEVVAVEPVPIATTILEGGGLRTVRAGDEVVVEVRDRRHADGLCGNEAAFYPPLVPLHDAHATYTLEHRFSGPGLNGTWRSPGKSSSWVGTFSR